MTANLNTIIPITFVAATAFVMTVAIVWLKKVHNKFNALADHIEDQMKLMPATDENLEVEKKLIIELKNKVFNKETANRVHMIEHYFDGKYRVAVKTVQSLPL